MKSVLGVLGVKASCLSSVSELPYYRGLRILGCIVFLKTEVTLQLCLFEG